MNDRRPKKKDKARKTFQKYGKYTQKSIRINEALKQNVPKIDNTKTKKKK